MKFENKLITTFAALLTIGNFLLSIFSSFGKVSNISSINIIYENLPSNGVFKFILFIIIESVLMYFFSKLVCWFLDNLLNDYFLFFVILILFLISAWINVFNIHHILYFESTRSSFNGLLFIINLFIPVIMFSFSYYEISGDGERDAFLIPLLFYGIPNSVIGMMYFIDIGLV